MSPVADESFEAIWKDVDSMVFVYDLAVTVCRREIAP